MPSRKKAKGQARKAVKAKNEVAAKVRELEEVFRDFEQSQIQRLQNNDQNSVSTICMHGFDPFPDDHVCIKFICAFVREFYKWFCKIYIDIAGKNAERIGIGSLLGALDATKDEYSEVWNDAAKMKQVIQYFLYNGTMNILDNLCGNAINSALFARFFEQWLRVKVHKSHACFDWSKVMECGLSYSDAHTLVKYFWRRIHCSCLDEAYEEVKSMPKMGLCFNSECRHQNRFVERSELKCCSRCRGVTYCSRECQVADWSAHESFCDWSLHKELCDEVAAAKAEYDASQQQQS